MLPILLVAILAQAPPPLSAKITQAPVIRPQPPPRPNPPPSRLPPPSRGVSPQFRQPIWHGSGHHGGHHGGYTGAYQYPITVYYRASEPAPLIPTNEVTNYGTESLSDYARDLRLRYERLKTRPISKEESP